MQEEKRWTYILTEKDGILYTAYCHSGYQIVERIDMLGWHNVWSILTETVFEQGNLDDYISYGTPLQGYDISDTSAIETLCPKELLESKAYVEAYVETYFLSGRDGSVSYLYVDGDFLYISVQISNEEYRSETELYSKDDCEEYIDLNFNISANPPTVVYITPYNNAGVAGDTITCEIPSNASGSISTGSSSYAVNDMQDQINCHGGIVVGYTTSYVVDGGSCATVCQSLGDTWHVTARNVCYNYGITWYELWDTDDGDYYGWVDADYIDFY